ncbi:MBL fold metallo-hydrolase [Stenotrophomonas sp. C3(2023)]|uniref:MBL fold metallo-hydrolase n=1 Tax=Stenotrophomonas sp. C3(2023) TaxID=3080277 RepID=UPI00293CDCE9|nr:MBL fold metallo-hydrolase [Stenotrophomonas sp. C3(2023)]MDV3469721.1 MBL fold metallo-hydrolase [Stenotrophomonas sp. C3(2023)]
MRILPLLLLALLLSFTALPAAQAVGSPPFASTGITRAAVLVHPFHPGPDAMFQVSSVVIEARDELLLVNAQFGRSDAERLVQWIRAIGKPLRTIYISHGDPDYYFGLATLQDAFPRARIVATPATVAHIRATSADKLAFWGPKMGTEAPTRIVIPWRLRGDRLRMKGAELRIIGLGGPDRARTTLWLPGQRVVLGGVLVSAGEHVWMADTQGKQSHQNWLAALQQLQALRPLQVIPGHYTVGAALDDSALSFTADYIRAFDEETARAADSTALIAAMRARYPDLAGVEGLELSARVAKGEIPWP